VFVATFLAPAVSLYGLFVLWPLAQALWLSFFQWRGVSANKTWIGIENYKKLVGDPAFLMSVKNAAWFLVVCGFVILILSLLIAHAAQGQSRVARAMRAIYLFPQVISLVVVAILWKFIFNPEYGLVTSAMNAVGADAYTKPWLGDSKTAIAAVGTAFVWWAMGFYIMLFAAGLKSLPTEVMEASSLDGASGFSKFFKVSWPMMWSVKRVAYTYIVINVLNIFALVYLMTQGGPDRATDVPLTYLYEQAFKNSQFGYGTSVAVVSFLLAITLSGALMYAMRKNPEGASG